MDGVGHGNTVDHKPLNFFVAHEQNGALWKISSRTTTVPRPGEGNVEWMLATGDSFNFNVLDYVNAENITLQLDSASPASHPYAS